VNQRLPLSSFPKPALDGLSTIEGYLKGVFERGFLELVKLRASQLNGCAFCIEMHYQEARAAGESEKRLYSLATWREAPYYSDRERAALAWTEAVTELAGGVDESLWMQVREHLDEAAIANLTIAVIAINAWNRWNVAMRTEVGNYQVGMFG